jgi:hypothetical protein
LEPQRVIIAITGGQVVCVGLARHQRRVEIVCGSANFNISCQALPDVSECYEARPLSPKGRRVAGLFLYTLMAS